MPPSAKPFSQEMLVLGTVVLSFLANLFVQSLWSQGDKSRDAIAELQRTVGILGAKIDRTQVEVEKQSGLLQQIVEGNQSREARITRLEMGIEAAEKSVNETNVLITRQLQRLEAQIADVQRALLPRNPR